MLGTVPVSRCHVASGNVLFLGLRPFLEWVALGFDHSSCLSAASFFQKYRKKQ